jgi:hypothetical protein
VDIGFSPCLETFFCRFKLVEKLRETIRHLVGYD